MTSSSRLRKQAHEILGVGLLKSDAVIVLAITIFVAAMNTAGADLVYTVDSGTAVAGGTPAGRPYNGTGGYGSQMSNPALTNTTYSGVVKTSWYIDTRATWEAAAIGTVNKDDFNGLTAGTYTPSASASTPSSPASKSYNSNAWAVAYSGTPAPYTFDSGNTNIAFHYGYTSAIGLTVGTQTSYLANGTQSIGVLGKKSGWLWLQFTPKEAAQGFAIDYENTYNNDYSDVGYLSWRFTFSDGTKKLVRFTALPSLKSGDTDSDLSSSTSSNDIDATWYDHYIWGAPKGFFGVRETGKTITNVEYFTHLSSSSQNLGFDNLTWDTVAVGVPEPTIGAWVWGVVGVVGAFVCRRRRGRG